MSGGSSPLRRNAFRSPAVKAVPLFNDGELSTASPRSLVSRAPLPFRGCGFGASSGTTLCRMAVTLFGSVLTNAAPSSGRRAARERGRGPLLNTSFSDAEGERAPKGQKTKQRHERQRARRGWERPVRFLNRRRRRRSDYLGELHFLSARLDGHDRSRFQLHCNGLVSRRDRLGDFGGDCVRSKENGRV